MLKPTEGAKGLVNINIWIKSSHCSQNIHSVLLFDSNNKRCLARNISYFIPNNSEG